MNASVSQHAPDIDGVENFARLAELEATTSTLRHDLLSMLAPALLVADCLLVHSDPKVVKAGETVVKVVIGVKQRLIATRPS